MAKLDFNTDNGDRGKFARMTIFVNLGKPLVSQILVNGALQQIEYENLPVVCFSCGRYEHNQDIYPNSKNNPGKLGENNETEKLTSKQEVLPKPKNHAQEGKEFSPCMLVERKQRRGKKEGRNGGDTSKKEGQGTSCFQVLENLNEEMGLEEIGPTCLDLSNTNKIQVQDKGLDTELDLPLGGSTLYRSGK